MRLTKEAGAAARYEEWRRRRAEILAFYHAGRRRCWLGRTFGALVVLSILNG